MQLTEQQLRFFETFGFLALPGLMRDEVAGITAEFEQVFVDHKAQHDGTKRTCIVPFIDQREKLCALLDNPKINGLISGVLDPQFNYIGSDGNYYTGDTGWHSDGFHTIGKYIKAAMYLDPVRRDTGCLRVIPGSHRIDLKGKWQALDAYQSQSQWGIEQRNVPAFPLESDPGDVVVFNHNIMHSAFGGSARRRMFTINCCAHASTPAEVQELKDYIASHDRFWIDHMHGDVMRRTASAARRVHLQQVVENEGHLPALAAAARQKMAEPSRG